MRLLYWTSVAFVLYAYFGYPLVLGVLSVLRPRTVRKGDIVPRVSFIITVHNEERRVTEKIENTLLQRYPRSRLEIIVASDCSTDRTDEIVRSFEPQGVRLVRAAVRRGKENAQREGIAASGAEIVVFSDVGTVLPSEGLAKIVRSFADPTVGCVSSVDRVLDQDGRVSGEGMYVRYEMLLRRLETKAGSLVGLSGSFFAARREVCCDWATDVQSDFGTLLNAVRIGLRGVSDSDSIGYYRTIVDESKEFERKVRTVLRGIATLVKGRELLNPLRYGMFAWQLWSHKVCRWLVPFAMVWAFASSAMLIGEPAYLLLFGLQVAFYAVALAGLLLQGVAGHWLVRSVTFFVLANLSIAKAWYRFAWGERVVAWTPSKR